MILTSTVFAMATGIVGAAVTVLGIMAAPIMVKTGYDGRLSAGAITAGGTLGILIPPSVMLIVMGPVLGVSVADLYASAFGPGFLLAGLYLVYCWAARFINPKLGPPVPKEERVHSAARDREGSGRRRGAAAVPDRGHARLDPRGPRDADRGFGHRRARRADPAAAGYRKLTYAGFKRAVLSADRDFEHGAAARGDLEHLRRGVLAPRHGELDHRCDARPAAAAGRDAGRWCVVLIFLLGWPFEWPAIILVFLPIFYPVMEGAASRALAASLGIPPDIVMVWFGALVAVTLQTAYLSPPVAMSAYYLRQVVREWSLATIYKGMFEFMILQCIAIALVIIFPAIATKFPEHLREEARGVKTEQVDDSANRLEEDPLKAVSRNKQEEEQGDSLEKDELSNREIGRRIADGADSKPGLERPAFFCYNGAWSSISMRRSSAPGPGARAGSRYAGRRHPALGGRQRFPRPARGARSARRARSTHGVFGYTAPPDALARRSSSASQRLYGWRVDPAWIVFLPGVIAGLHLAARKLVRARRATCSCRRRSTSTSSAPPSSRRAATAKFRSCCSGAAGFSIEDFLKKNKCQAFYPVQSAESRRHHVPPRGARGARRADRRHAHRLRRDPLRPRCSTPGKPHVPIASLAPEVSRRTVTLMSPSKTFNFPAAGCAWAIIEDAQLRKAFAARHRRARAALGLGVRLRCHARGLPRTAMPGLRRSSNTCAATATWWRDCYQGLPMAHVEATYLAWIDCSALGIPDAHDFFLQHGVALSPGSQFGDAALRAPELRNQRKCSRKRCEADQERIQAEPHRLSVRCSWGQVRCGISFGISSSSAENSTL